MTKITVPVFLLLFGIIFSKCSEKESVKVGIAKDFYTALDNSNSSKAIELITDRFTTIDDGFEQNYNSTEYAEWVRWDSVFQPTYEILKIENENGIVKAKVSKMDKRISFLHSEPIITQEIIHFEGNNIKSITRTSASFNVEMFITNRDRLVNWIAQHKPELNGFLHDQTKSGGIKYLEAIEVYKTKQTE